MSQKSRRNNIRSHSLHTIRTFYSDGWDLRKHLERRAQQAILGENSVQRKLYSTEYKMEIQNLERRNSELALFESQRELGPQRCLLLEANQYADQAQRERIQSCSRLEMQDHLHQECYARSCREIEEFQKTLLSRGKYWQNNEDWKNFVRSMIRNHEQWVYSSTILTCWADMTYQRSSSSSCYLEFTSIEAGMPRNTREDMSIPRNFWSSTCSTRSWRTTQKFKKFGDIIGDSEKRRNLRIVGAKNHCNQYLYVAFQ